jgi:hypothetical protein
MDVRLTLIVTRTAALVALAIAADACHYAGPLAGGGSQIAEGTPPDRVRRLLTEAGGARPADAILPTTASDSAAIYMIVVDQRALGLTNASVAILPHAASMPNFPKEGWQHVDPYGVFVQRFAAGEYVVYVQDQYHWAARKLVQLHAGRVDTLLAVMRSGMNGDRTFQPFP